MPEEVQEKERIKPLLIDLSDWDKRPWFQRTEEVANELEAKGFVVLKTGLRSKIRAKARTEVEELKSYGALHRTTKEVQQCLLGEVSCWSMQLNSLEDGENPLREEVALRELEEHLSQIGESISVVSHRHFKATFTGRMPLRLHHSKMPGERGEPPLQDLNDADHFLNEAKQKRLIILYYFGPGESTVTLTPDTNFGANKKADKDRIFEATLHEECVIVYRNDSVKLEFRTKHQVVIAQQDYPVRTRAHVLSKSKDKLAPPEPISQWLDDHLQLRIEQERFDIDIPYRIKHEGMRSFSSGNAPVRVIQFHQDLPGIPHNHTGIVPPIDASLIGGADIVTEVKGLSDVGKRTQEAYELSKKNKGQHTVSREIFNAKKQLVRTYEDWGSKWDMDEYYDEDPKNAAQFKMYTKHMAIINRGHDPADDFNFAEYGILGLEKQTIDPKHRMIMEACSKCYAAGNFADRIAGEDVGFYVGISGTNDQFGSFIMGVQKMSKFTWTNMNNAAAVSRLSYYAGSTGPCIAIDTEDSSGLGAVDSAVRDLRTERSNPFAVVGAVSYVANPYQMIILCAAGLLAKSGRTRCFDESSDGFCKGEGAIAAVMEPGDWVKIRKQDQIFKNPSATQKTADPVGIRCVIKGTACNAQGSSSSLGVQSPASIRDLIKKCCTDAGGMYEYLDAIEADASGRKMCDLIELGVLAKENAVHDSGAYCVPIRTHKTCLGNSGPCNGIVSMLKCTAFFERAIHGPQVHLRQLMDLDGIPYEEGQGPSRLMPLTEAIPSNPFQTVAINSFSNTGTNYILNIQGRVPQEEFLIKQKYGKLKTSGKKLFWWPGGSTTEDSPPLRGYFITGTWSNWEYTYLMEPEGDGVFAYNLIMGDNNYENFQIWIDEDPDKVLHPVGKDAKKNTEVMQPDELGSVSRSLSWLVDGRSKPTRMINEEQAKVVKSRKKGVAASDELRIDDSGVAVTFDEFISSLPAAQLSRMNDAKRLEAWDKLWEEDKLMNQPCMPVYAGSYFPPPTNRDVNNDARPGSFAYMPVVRPNAEDASQPGDLFRIRLHVRNKFKRVEWTKVKVRESSQALAVRQEAQNEEYNHKYMLIGDHTYWNFEEMERDPGEPGLFTKVIHMLKDVQHFQIYRNGDWEQGFFPDEAGAGMSNSIIGPSNEGHGLNWRIEGQVGDLVRIEFKRKVGAVEEKTIRWHKEGNAEVDFRGIMQGREWYVSGSFGVAGKAMRMDKLEHNEENGLAEDHDHFTVEITVGATGQEFFQLLLDGNYLAALHPGKKDATWYDEAVDAQTLVGPDDQGSGNYWVIGSHQNDAAIGKGIHAIIHLHVEKGVPKRVYWERYESPDSQREYLAQGCWNIFDRHCRMLGFRPCWHGTIPAKFINPPTFWRMQKGETKIDGEQVKDFGRTPEEKERWQEHIKKTWAGGPGPR